jgi:hypothetical protein
LKSAPNKWFARLYLEKKPSQKRAGGVSQGVGPEFKPLYCQINKAREARCGGAPCKPYSGGRGQPGLQRETLSQIYIYIARE